MQRSQSSILHFLYQIESIHIEHIINAIICQVYNNDKQFTKWISKLKISKRSSLHIIHLYTPSILFAFISAASETRLILYMCIFKACPLSLAAVQIEKVLFNCTSYSHAIDIFFADGLFQSGFVQKEKIYNEMHWLYIL